MSKTANRRRSVERSHRRHEPATDGPTCVYCGSERVVKGSWPAVCRYCSDLPGKEQL